MYWSIEVSGYWSVLYYIALIVFGSLFVAELLVAVIYSAYKEAAEEIHNRRSSLSAEGAAGAGGAAASGGGHLSREVSMLGMEHHHHHHHHQTFSSGGFLERTDTMGNNSDRDRDSPLLSSIREKGERATASEEVNSKPGLPPINRLLRNALMEAGPVNLGRATSLPAAMPSRDPATEATATAADRDDVLSPLRAIDEVPLYEQGRQGKRPSLSLHRSQPSPPVLQSTLAPATAAGSQTPLRPPSVSRPGSFPSNGNGNAAAAANLLVPLLPLAALTAGGAQEEKPVLLPGALEEDDSTALPAAPASPQSTLAQLPTSNLAGSNSAGALLAARRPSGGQKLSSLSLAGVQRKLLFNHSSAGGRNAVAVATAAVAVASPSTPSHGPMTMAMGGMAMGMSQSSLLPPPAKDFQSVADAAMSALALQRRPSMALESHPTLSNPPDRFVSLFRL